MSMAGRTNGLWRGAYAPIPPMRDFVIVRRKKVLPLSLFFTMRLRNLSSWLIHVMALSLKQLRSISARALLFVKATAFS